MYIYIYIYIFAYILCRVYYIICILYHVKEIKWQNENKVAML